MPCDTKLADLGECRFFAFWDIKTDKIAKYLAKIDTKWHIENVFLLKSYTDIKIRSLLEPLGIYFTAEAFTKG